MLRTTLPRPSRRTALCATEKTAAPIPPPEKRLRPGSALRRSAEANRRSACRGHQQGTRQNAGLRLEVFSGLDQCARGLHSATPQEVKNSHLIERMPCIVFATCSGSARLREGCDEDRCGRRRKYSAMEIFHCAAVRRAAPIVSGNIARARFIVRRRFARRAVDSFRSFSPLRRTTELKASPVGSLSRIFVAERAHRAHHSDRAGGRLAQSYFRKSRIRHERLHGPVAGALLDLPAPGLHRAVGQRKAANLSAPATAPSTRRMVPASAARACAEWIRWKPSEQDGQLLVRFQYFRQLVADKEVIG